MRLLHLCEPAKPTMLQTSSSCMKQGDSQVRLLTSASAIPVAIQRHHGKKKNTFQVVKGQMENKVKCVWSALCNHRSNMKVDYRQYRKTALKVSNVFRSCIFTDGLVVCHLPFGPTAYFTLYNVVMRHDVPDIGTMSEAYPHLIFHNFTSRLGKRVSKCWIHAL